MTIDIKAFIAECRDLGLDFSLDGERLKVRGPVQLLTPELKQRMKNHKSDLLQFLRAGDENLPLSSQQARLWFLEQMTPSAAYHAPASVCFKGPLNVVALEQSLQALVARHEALRTVFEETPQGPRAKILPSMKVRLDHYGADDAKALADQRKPFDLSKGPLLRVALCRHHNLLHYLHLCIHHIVTDEWSQSIFDRELMALYQAFSSNRPSPLPALTHQYKDYVALQKSRLQSPEAQTQLAWWKNHLEGYEEPMDLVLEERDSADHKAGRVAFHLDQQLTDEVQRLGANLSATPFMILLAAFHELLARYAGRRDTCISTPIANRDKKKWESVFGFFTNTLAVRLRSPEDLSFQELVGQVKSTLLEAYDHQAVPFEEVVKVTETRGDVQSAPLFQVMFVLHQRPHRAVTLGELTIENQSLEPDLARLDLVLSFTHDDHGMQGLLEYRANLFDTPTMTRFGQRYVSLLQQVTEHPRHKLTAQACFTDEDRSLAFCHLLKETTSDCLPVAQRAAQWAERDGTHVAQRFGSYARTRSQLQRRVAHIAAAMAAHGIGPGKVVGMCLSPGPERVAATQAVFYLGATFLPLDPNWPNARRQDILVDANAKLILTDGQHIDTFDQTFALLNLDNTPFPQNPVPLAEPCPELPAYIIYTSGTTGKPKGIVASHGAYAQTISGLIKDWQLQETSRVSQLISCVFDPSLMELGIALGAGACLVGGEPAALLPGLDLANFYRDHRITHSVVVPSMLAVTPEVDLPHLDWVLCGGEACPIEVLQTWSKGRHFVNGYGPTETSIIATQHLCSPDQEQVHIGVPVAHTSAYILRNGQPVLPGRFGELAIGGPRVTMGYVNRPAQTAAVFVPDPHGGPGSRMYLSGDRVRLLPDGNLYFAGRLDQQVKIRGFRIEPAEVEKVLASLPWVKQAVVLADVSAGVLHGFVTCDQPETFDRETAGDLLRDRLPEYMVPTTLSVLAQLPLLRNGKLDRSALETLAAHAERSDYQAPSTELEQQLCGLWAELLGERVKVGVTDDFFSLGGHSLLATRLASHIEAHFGVRVPLVELFSHRTVEAQVTLLEEQLQKGDGIQAQPRNYENHDFLDLPQSHAQQRLWFLYQARPESSWYNTPLVLQLKGAFNPAKAQHALTQLVMRHEILRTYFGQRDQEPVQIVLKEYTPALNVIDLEGFSVQEAQRIARDAVARPFQLTSLPLLRTYALRLNADEYLLVFNMHHIISDGWSVHIMARDFTNFYEGRQVTPLPIQYGDYAQWQNTALRDGLEEQQLAYWKNQLQGAPRGVDLKPDFTGDGTRERGVHGFRMTPDQVHQMNQWTLQQGVTPFMFLLAVFKLLLWRYTGERDLVVGTAVANRNHAELENLIGFFVNSLVMRSHIQSEQNFSQFLAHLKQVTLEAFAHQDLPYDTLVQHFCGERDRVEDGLFNIMFTVQNLPQAQAPLSHVNIEQLPLMDQETHFPLTPVFLPQTDGSLNFELTYHKGLFQPQQMVRLVNAYEYLIQAVLQQDLPMRRYALSQPVTWESTSVQEKVSGDLVSAFERIAAQHPQKMAVIEAGHRHSYQTINQRANGLAQKLLELGLEREEAVVVAMSRSTEMVIAVLGILKAGGYYVGLDAKSPASRQQYMSVDCKARMAVADEQWSGPLPPQIVRLGNDVLPHFQRPAIDSRQLAYVCFTSGTTGKPKGVGISHEAVLNLAARPEAYDYQKGDTTLFGAALAFDASTIEMFLPLLHGGSLAVLPEGGQQLDQLGEILLGERVGWAFLNTALFQTLLDHRPHALAQLTTLWSGGEAASPGHFQRAKDLYPALTLANVYGPTETTVFASAWHTDQPLQRRARLPIGAATPGKQLYVLDQDLAPVAPGFPGELCIGGACLGRGYLGKPARTAVSFVPDPFGDGERVYKTGDMVRLDTADQVVFLGRKDSQLKIRGYRIEPGEIESVLLSHPSVAEAVVFATKDAEPTLAAFACVTDWRQEDRLERWGRLFDRDMAGAHQYDPKFHHAGWDDMYSGAPIPAGEMRQWHADTLAKILATDTSRVLELGCGNGLFTFPLLDHCSRYVGVDPAQAALDHVREHLPTDAPVELLQRRAHEQADLDRDFTVVVLNSVVQYFPGAAYLEEVMDKALDRLGPSGTLFVGDVRHLGLHLHLCADIALFQAEEHAQASEITGEAQAAMTREGELLIDPDFFYAYAKSRSRITGVEVLLKDMEAHNELSRFRYDVRLHLAPRHVLEPTFIPWEDGVLAQLPQLLESSEALVVSGIPNGRLSRTCSLLSHGKQPQTTEALRSRFLDLPAEPDPSLLAVEETFLDYQRRIMLGPNEDPTRFSLVFTRDGHQEIIWPNSPKTGELCNRPVTTAQEQAHALKTWLDERLPEYMSPHRLVVVEQIPRTAGNKPDRAHLLTLVGPQSQGYVAPKTDEERQLATLWCELLGVDRVGAMDNFFQMGGHSLLVIRLVDRINHHFGTTLSLTHIYQAQTLRAQALLLGQQTQTDMLVTLKPGDGAPWILVHPGGGQIHWYQSLAQSLTGPVVALQSPGLVGKPQPQTLAACIELYADAVARHVPTGPIQLAGWSVGGVLAFQLAIPLQKRGRDVSRLVLLDTKREQPIEGIPRSLLTLRFLQDMVGAPDPAKAASLLTQLQRGETAAVTFARAQEQGLISVDWQYEDVAPLLDVYLANLKMTACPPKNHRFTGKTLLVCANDTNDTETDVSLEWSAHCTQLSIRRLPGNHYTMLTEPNLPKLVDWMEET